MWREQLPKVILKDVLFPRATIFVSEKRMCISRPLLLEYLIFLSFFNF
jgi:hypothetical protein